MAHSRTAWRTWTRSGSERIGRLSCLTTAMPGPRRRAPRADHLHSLLDVERRAHAGQLAAELHERDRDRRTHAHHDRPRVEHPRHRGYVRQHPADEGADDVEGGDVDP